MCVKLHFYLIIWLVCLYGMHRLDQFLIFYLFAVLHELAHIAVALFLKVKIKEIVLLPVGVCAKFDYIEKKKKEILIAVAGPLFSIIIAFCTTNTLYKEINMVIAILNLIPVYPLDGGRMVRGILEHLLGYKKSIVVCHILSRGIFVLITLTGISLFVYFHNISLLLLAIYIFFLIQEESKKDRIKETIYHILEKS